MTDTTSTTELPIPDLAKAAKRVTKKDINDLLAGFVPAAKEQESLAAQERAARHAEVDRIFAGVVADLTEEDPGTATYGASRAVRILDGDLVLAERTLKGLQAARTAAHKAIDSITDAKLDPTPAAPKNKPATSRVSVPKTEKPATPEPTLDEKLAATRERVAAEKAAAEEEEIASSENVLVSDADAGPRGAVDPNADGF